MRIQTAMEAYRWYVLLHGAVYLHCTQQIDEGAGLAKKLKENGKWRISGVMASLM